MNLRNPRMIGSGISNAQTLKAAQDNAAGAIIGSKFVALLNEANGDADTALQQLYATLEKWKDSITKLQNYILFFRCYISNLQIVNIKILSYINIININIR